MATYSFKDIQASLVGVGGSINLGAGAAVAEEGITIEPAGDKNKMTIGADGRGMHSLLADESSRVTVTLLKTSPTNALLQTMYNIQTLTAAAHGKNVITVRDSARGDFITLTEVAFKKAPSISYSSDGGTVKWEFDAVRTVRVLGSGTPEI